MRERHRLYGRRQLRQQVSSGHPLLIAKSTALSWHLVTARRGAVSAASLARSRDIRMAVGSSSPRTFTEQRRDKKWSVIRPEPGSTTSGHSAILVSVSSTRASAAGDRFLQSPSERQTCRTSPNPGTEQAVETVQQPADPDFRRGRSSQVTGGAVTGLSRPGSGWRGPPRPGRADGACGPCRSGPSAAREPR